MAEKPTAKETPHVAERKDDKLPAPAEGFVRATVAKGRTVTAPHRTEKKIIGYNPEGKPIERPKTVEYPELTEVDLPEAEVAELRALGYLIDPDAAAKAAAEAEPAAKVTQAEAKGARVVG